MWGPSEEEIVSVSSKRCKYKLGLGSWEWRVSQANQFSKPEFTKPDGGAGPSEEIEHWKTTSFG